MLDFESPNPKPNNERNLQCHRPHHSTVSNFTTPARPADIYAANSQILKKTRCHSPFLAVIAPNVHTPLNWTGMLLIRPKPLSPHLDPIREITNQTRPTYRHNHLWLIVWKRRCKLLQPDHMSPSHYLVPFIRTTSCRQQARLYFSQPYPPAFMPKPRNRAPVVHQNHKTHRPDHLSALPEKKSPAAGGSPMAGEQRLRLKWHNERSTRSGRRNGFGLEARSCGLLLLFFKCFAQLIHPKLRHLFAPLVHSLHRDSQHLSNLLYGTKLFYCIFKSHISFNHSLNEICNRSLIACE